MGKRGPAPKPSEQKKLEGTYRPDRAARNEFVPTPGTPEMPAWLDKEGRAEWARIVPELAAKGLLSSVHASSLADLCAAHSLSVRAEKKVLKQGLIVKTAQGPLRNPLIKVAQEARSQANALRREFGLTPSAASKVSVPEQPKKDATEDFLFGGLTVVAGGRDG